ncbi:hypothetical protein C4573_05490 [Candidatus Woesearchaeota archaeon]|nr:MAG: hypothetical protein C4573_05490 [Candidatus Woesearchaeota archaeon]
MDIVAKARNYAVSEIEQYGAPTLIAFEISEKKALELAKKLKADVTIVHLGIMLMDVKLGQAMKENKLREHVAMSSLAAKEFLKESKLDEATKKKIINCIEAHHKAVPFSCLESEICANADCYRFMTPKGFLSFLASLGKRDGTFEAKLKLAEEKLDEKYDILSLDICKKELEGHYQNLKRLIADAKVE